MILGLDVGGTQTEAVLIIFPQIALFLQSLMR